MSEDEPRTLKITLKEEVWEFPPHREWTADLEQGEGPGGVFPGRGQTIPEALRDLATKLEYRAHTVTNEAIYQYAQNPNQGLKVVPLEPFSEDKMEKITETFGAETKEEGE